MVDVDNVTNHANLAHHSAVGQWYVTAANNTITAISGGTVVLSGSLLTLYANVVAGGPSSPNLP